ncbi:MAG TPA: hypothetical protein VK517_09850 [Cyclobacteriaceae bacterium]|nr:hypothetical protein [Cyclobacteriaceae bacterium]
MSAVLLAEFKNKKDADLIVELIGQLRSGKVLSRGKDVEELYFAELIKTGYKEKGYISSAAFKKYLAKRIGKRTG